LADMHALRKTNQDLVFVDSTIWLAVLLLGFSVFAGYRSYVQGSRIGFVAAGFLVLCGFLFWRKEIVTFDAGRQQANWIRRRAFASASGSVPFSEITGIGMETTSGSRGELSYRLTILTNDKPVPMSDVYSGNHKHYEGIRQQILTFLHLDAGVAQAGEGVERNGEVDDEASVVSLLKQGRRIDAIHLVRSSQKIGLAEATDRVAHILEKMKVTQ
jgi:hypothetical protein